MTQLKFISGQKTIGGTIIEMSSNNKRLIFDFGSCYDPDTNIELKPTIDGIYGDDVDTFDHSSILISHLHLDHTKAINLVPLNIPIYMSKLSKEFLETLYETGFNDIMGQPRTYTGLDFNKKCEISGFNVEFIEVDHDVLGASSILITNKDVKVLYTGDLRLSGLNDNLTPEMIDYVKDLGIDLVITESVTFSFIDEDYKIIPSNTVLESEKDFVTILYPQVIDKPLLFNSYIMGTQRMESIINLSKKLNKKVVFTKTYASIVKKYITNDILVLGEDITLEEISKDINSYACQFDYNKKDDYTFFKGATLMQTGGEPLGEFDSRWLELEDFCKENDINLLKCGIGGHATVENLQYIVNSINSKYTFPLHGFKPELLVPATGSQIMVPKGESIRFENGKIV